MIPTPDDVTLDPLATRTVAAAGVGVATLASNAFAPGAVVAGRYRLVALLGRGGMGEVYRADDLTLDEPVALKFLPEGVMAGDGRLNRLHNELRIARQVSHRNVCRVYDLGEVNGRPFLTMEYVDGEDLASLLRRIGRIPQDKAVEIARQLCAGVAAAHDRGVLHRDLKPANVMIDGDGNVRITDFGIATAKDNVDEGFAGTPQYMAPEQIAGRPASIRSDIYALGLVLFELFTGRRAVDARTLADLKTFHTTGAVTTPSSIVKDLDPAVERTILRCLEREPDRRPASALVVAASLPGADPLAAALAAGETPSPELLAAAGETDALALRWAALAATFAIIGIIVFAGLSARTSFVGRVPLPEPPEVLVDRAEGIVASLGYDEAFADRAYNFSLDDEYIRWVQQSRPTPQRWEILAASQPSALRFWYRTSPRPLRPVGEDVVSRDDPPATIAVVGIIAFAGLSARTSFAGRVPLPEPPDVLVDRAEGIVAALGYDEAFADRAYNFSLDDDYIRWVQEARRTPQRWEILSASQPSVLRFWYRTSPRPLRLFAGDVVSRDDPPATIVDMRTLILDTKGRLLAFRSVPPQAETADAPATPVPWDTLFLAAGLPISEFTAVTPQWTPRDYADQRAAWEGPLPEQPDVRVRVEAAAYRGKPVFFEVIGPWTRPTLMVPTRVPTADLVLQGLFVVVMIGLIAFAAVVARRNVLVNRADRRGAARLAGYLMLAGFVAWAIRAHHVLDANALLASFFRGGGPLMLFAAILWIVYIAVEPYVRRFWPDSLLGWSRLLAGHVRDPRVGRDALIGLVAGTALAFGELARSSVLAGLGYPAPRPIHGTRVEVMARGTSQVAEWLSASVSDTMESLFTVLIVVVLRLMFRRNWIVLPITAFILALTSARQMGGTTSWIMLFPIASGIALTFVVMRYGLLPLVVTRWVWGLLVSAPLTLNVGHWSATASNATLALFVAFALFAFYASRAGQPLFGTVLKELPGR